MPIDRLNDSLDLLKSTTPSEKLYSFDLRKLVTGMQIVSGGWRSNEMGGPNASANLETYTHLRPRSLQLEQAEYDNAVAGRSLRSQRTLYMDIRGYKMAERLDRRKNTNLLILQAPHAENC
jgi:hypothetical protein